VASLGTSDLVVCVEMRWLAPSRDWRWSWFFLGVRSPQYGAEVAMANSGCVPLPRTLARRAGVVRLYSSPHSRAISGYALSMPVAIRVDAFCRQAIANAMRTHAPGCNGDPPGLENNIALKMYWEGDGGNQTLKKKLEGG
jgi:hypothetical protein